MLGLLDILGLLKFETTRKTDENSETARDASNRQKIQNCETREIRKMFLRDTLVFERPLTCTSPILVR